MVDATRNRQPKAWKQPPRGVGRPIGSVSNPTTNRLMARLEKDYPDFHPVLSMVEGAMAMHAWAKEDRAMWPEAIAACDRVAKYLVPTLKATEVTVKEPTRLIIIDAAADTDDILT